MKGIVNKRFWLTLPVLGAAVIITFFLIQEMVSYGEEPIDSSVQNDFSYQDGQWIYYIDLGKIMRLNIKGDKAEVVMQPEYTVDGSGNQIEANLTYLG